MFEQYLLTHGYRKFGNRQYYPSTDSRVTITKMSTSVIVGILGTTVTINNCDPEITVAVQKSLSALL